MSTPRDLIHPQIVKLHEQSKADNLETEAEYHKQTGSWTLDRVPIELRTFIEDLDLDTLVKCVRASPLLYCHPIVIFQLDHLQRAQFDQEMWRRLGWDLQSDNHPFPVEADVAAAATEAIILTHVKVRLPWRRIVLKGLPEKRGRKPGFENANSTNWQFERLESPIIKPEFRRLNEIFKSREDLPGLADAALDGELLGQLVEEVAEILDEIDPIWCSAKTYGGFQKDFKSLDPGERLVAYVRNVKPVYDLDHLKTEFKRLTADGGQLDEDIRRWGPAAVLAAMVIAALASDDDGSVSTTAVLHQIYGSKPSP